MSQKLNRISKNFIFYLLFFAIFKIIQTEVGITKAVEIFVRSALFTGIFALGINKNLYTIAQAKLKFHEKDLFLSDLLWALETLEFYPKTTIQNRRVKV